MESWFWRFTAINSKVYIFENFRDESVDDMITEFNFLRVGHLPVKGEDDLVEYRIHHTQFIKFEFMYKKDW